MNNLNPLLEINLSNLTPTARQTLANRIASKQSALLKAGSNPPSRQYFRQKGMLARLNAQGATGTGAQNASGKFLYEPEFLKKMTPEKRQIWLNTKQGLDSDFRNYVQDGIHLDQDMNAYLRSIGK